VICHFTVLEKYERFWLDLDQDVVLGSGLCESLRHLSERWGEAVGSSIGLRTLNERINQMAPVLEQAHQTPITQVPPVIQFDGIWVRRPRADGNHENGSAPSAATATQGEAHGEAFGLGTVG